jgi:hypothetical protein
MLIDGDPQKNIAASVGVCQATISNFKNRNDIKRIIESCQTELICRGAKGTVDNHVNIIELAREIISYLKSGQAANDWFDSLTEKFNKLGLAAKDILTLADKKEKRVGQSAGYFATHSQSPVTVNILNQRNTVINDPTILRAIERYAHDDSILDVEINFDHCESKLFDKK